MTGPAFPQDGGCRCGAVRIRLNAAPVMAHACHCSGCQRMTGSAFSATLMMRADAFEVTKGPPVVGGLKGPEVHHMHCPDCMSWVFTTFGRPIVNVRAVMMDDTSWIAPYAENWVTEKLPWAQTGARHSFPQFPPPDAREDLMRDYATYLDQMET